MKEKFLKYFKGDTTIWIAVFLLSIVSMLTVYSATGTLAYKKMGGNTMFYLIRHGGFLLVADEELKGLTFGDNDWLSSLIVKLVRADALVLLTTVDGLLDGSGRRVPSIGSIRDAMKLVHAGQKGSLSKGGMDSKLRAVKNAAQSGAHVVIANAATPHILQSIFSGRDVGTFVPGSAL